MNPVDERTATCARPPPGALRPARRVGDLAGDVASHSVIPPALAGDLDLLRDGCRTGGSRMELRPQCPPPAPVPAGGPGGVDRAVRAAPRSGPWWYRVTPSGAVGMRAAASGGTRPDCCGPANSADSASDSGEPESSEP
eukprot:483340-Prorocentrum_minimum.AAC.1